MSPHAAQREGWLFKGSLDRDREARMTAPLPPLPPSPEITEEDVARAKQAWKQAAPPQFRELLEGKPEEGGRPNG